MGKWFEIKDLHSTMVRFIMQFAKAALLKEIKFTFHYGQIYYHYIIYVWEITFYIYIPLWLDLLYKCCYSLLPLLLHLHSTMVRFIISSLSFTIILLSHLHSTMVRFIIIIYPIYQLLLMPFTFHYGQIYYYNSF